MPNRTSQLADVPEFMRRFWGACPTRACGFKLLNSQIKPPEKAAQIFTVSSRPRPFGASSAEVRGAQPSPTPVKRLLLERANIGAEFASWRKALATGNWGTSPEAQRLQASANRTERLAFRGNGCRGCGPEGIAKNQAVANSIGPARFAAQHRAWFTLARRLAPTNPLLHIFTENLTASMVACNHTMARVYAFLELPPLPSNCDMSKVPLEWPCDIRTDPSCSMEKYGAGGPHGQDASSVL